MTDPPNPLRAAMDARDPTMIEAALAADVVIRSPIFSAPLEGRELATEVFSVVYEVLGDVAYPLEVPGEPHLFAWRSDIGGEPVEGIDMFRRNDAGEVSEVTIYMRPLSGVAAFLQAAGRALAARRGGGRALAIRSASFPVAPLMKLTAKVGPRLLGTPPAS
jgi:hypothetical protein